MKSITKLQRQRLLKGLSLEEMAEQLGVDKGTLSRVERGITTPKKNLARKIFAFFDRELSLGCVYDVNFEQDEES